MDGCPFCAIVAGERDREIVYADDSVVAFLCEPPAVWGHVLVVPRAHRPDIWSIPVEEAQAAIAVAQLLAGVARSELGAQGVNLRQNNGDAAGQDVSHFHLHVIPRYEDDTLGRACVWGAPPWEPPAGGEAERRRVAEAIRRGVGAGLPKSGEGAAAAILDGEGRLLLIRENYDRRRYGLPGGTVEPGESPLAAVVREVREEVGLEVRVDDIVGIYRLDNGFSKAVFRCSIVAGSPSRPAPDEIAEVGWFALDAIPSPVTNSLHYALPDIAAGARGVVRENLPRLS